MLYNESCTRRGKAFFRTIRTASVEIREGAEVLMNTRTLYYVITVLVIIVWGTTFVSTKILLEQLSPVEIMFYRYCIAYAALWVAYPRFHRPGTLREELLFVGAGFFGGTLYFLTENYALKFTQVSNVGLLLATSPILTALAAHCFTKTEKLNRSLGFGFLMAFIGTFFVIFNGHFILKLNPLGDMLAIASSCSWAVYSVLIKKIGANYNSIYVTRKVFFYSILTMLPTLFLMDFRWDISILFDTGIMANLLFLGILASSICFLLWSKVIWKLGAVTVNNFIYLIPLITMIASAIVLSEQITLVAVMGGLCILAGVAVSTRR